jgi:hypothetical protein
MSDKTALADFQMLLALESARSAQALLWERQRNLAAALGRRLREQINDSQDAAMCVYVQDVAVADGPLADPEQAIKHLLMRVRAA